MKFAYSVSLVLVAAVSIGCDDHEAPDIGESHEAIVGAGGLPATAFDGLCRLDVDPPTVDMMTPDDFVCSCTMLAPGVVLTSARCVVVSEEQVPNDRLTLYFGLDSSDGPYAVNDIEVHRYFDATNSAPFQLAFVRYTGTPSETPAVTHDADLPANFVDQMVSLVGYGETTDGAADFGTRLAVEVEVASIASDRFSAGIEDTATTCEGDSGGPVFADFGNGPVVVGVTARTFDCEGGTARQRIDIHRTTFIEPYVDRFSGACLADGNCVTAGCRTPDPDCAGNECQWGNTCQEDCPTRDWDCPIGSFTGEACTKDGDCEQGGRCVAAADDAAFLYCSRPCDPNGTIACPANMTCTDVAGTNECVFNTPSNGSQGFECSINAECRSDICEEGICVFPCDPSDPSSCTGDFVCGPSTVAEGTNVCLGEVFSGGGGFCQAASGQGKTGALLLILAAIGFGFRRRRRS